MSHLVTNKQFAKAVCAELSIDPNREDAPVHAVSVESSGFGDLTKISVTVLVGYGLIPKIGQRMVADAAAEQVITAMFPADDCQQP